jgi:hypothetical protein
LDGLIHDAEDVLVTFPTSLTLSQMDPTPLPTLDAIDVAMVDAVFELFQEDRVSLVVVERILSDDGNTANAAS